MTVRGRAVRAVVAGLVVALCATACASGGEAAAPGEEPLIRRTYDEDPTERESSEATVDDASAAAAAVDPLSPDIDPTDRETVAPADLVALDTPMEPDDGPPLAEVTGRDWDQVARDLFGLFMAAYERRDVDISRMVFTEESEDFAAQTQAINDMLAFDVRRLADGPAVVTDVDFLLEERTLVTLEVTIDAPGLAEVDATGRVIDQRESEVVRERWTLVNVGEGRDGPWRIAIARPLDDEPSP